MCYVNCCVDFVILILVFGGRYQPTISCCFLTFSRKRVPNYLYTDILLVLFGKTGILIYESCQLGLLCRICQRVSRKSDHTQRQILSLSWKFLILLGPWWSMMIRMIYSNHLSRERPVSSKLPHKTKMRQSKKIHKVIFKKCKLLEDDKNW